LFETGILIRKSCVIQAFKGLQAKDFLTKIRPRSLAASGMKSPNIGFGDSDGVRTAAVVTYQE
jgi:hypothetical protein